uniref:Uncharacterized protein n=1 Tax=Sinocyclocheilus grahami TaxID=75366 RepID=A0A672RNI2_SINGR
HSNPAPSMSLTAFNTESCTLNIDFICFLCSSIGVILTLFSSFAFFALSGGLCILPLLSLPLRQQEEAERFDAFISYNTKDEPWVMEELIPKLEGEHGRPIIDKIIDGIYSSRKTNCLITKKYLMSNWSSSEVASFRLFDKRTYLHWPKPGEGTKVFWQKLKMALETKEGHKSDHRMIL